MGKALVKIFETEGSGAAGSRAGRDEMARIPPTPALRRLCSAPDRSVRHGGVKRRLAGFFQGLRALSLNS